MSTTTLPQTMRALLQPSIQETRLIQTTLGTPIQDLNDNEHLIRVHCVSPCANELNWLKYFPPPKPRTQIPCYDIAGTVVKSPENSPFSVGDEVYARTNYLRPGCASDYAIAVTDELAHRPQNLSWAESTAVPLSAQTAWQALFVQSAIGAFDSDEWKGKRVLVTAASGGVGIWVTQLARLVGATVVGTCGSRNVGFVKGLGASEVIDYRKTDLRAWAEEPGSMVDVVVDCVGGKSLADAWWCVKDGGVLVSIFQPPEQVRPEGLKEKRVKSLFFVMEPKREHLEAITKLVEAGKCRPAVDSIWPLELFEEAFARLDGGHARGKIILDLTLNQ
ncbi:zinc-binding oxidoreductase [Aspergillus nomiae NRRL 13137]|uniref:Zinc-binding oxidoreductase n=1 Tax=Aspergillus nomiae NRRL (strain ATCC 15546 / NRRL 13137 / CBS 260.88 / M93) TaxID=1509407 RepID=A0A0L1JHB8_ASPN3|nr:zinc-binding oxidoreductase [Aspergillus nomiae NRRL 13137]KNG91165.1 zinc-binding oxidoreductase [Aspergillus nomiae NRRL 13137]